MITKWQYKFLKRFMCLSKKKSISKATSKKLPIETFAKLLSKHPQLNPAKPFINNESSDDYLEGSFLETYINDCYLEEIGLKEIIIYNNSSYEITQKGLILIDEYKREHMSKIKLPIIAICVSILSIIISIISLILSIKQ